MGAGSGVRHEICGIVVRALLAGVRRALVAMRRAYRAGATSPSPARSRQTDAASSSFHTAT